MRNGQDQGGFTLIEAVISIAITAMVILGLAAGLLTAVRSSDAAARTQRKDSALASFSESLKTAPYPEVASGCPSLTDFQTSWDDYVADGKGWTDPDVSNATITGVEYWDPGSGDYEPACPGADAHVNRLTLEVTVHGETSVGQVVVNSQ